MIHKVSETQIVINNAKKIYQVVIIHMSLVDNIIIDLSEVEKVDTSGIAVLMAWWQYAIAHEIECAFKLSAAVEDSLNAYHLKLP